MRDWFVFAVAFFCFSAVLPAQADDVTGGFGDSYFSNTQAPGLESWDDPAVSAAETVSVIEPAAGGEDVADDIAPEGDDADTGAENEESSSSIFPVD